MAPSERPANRLHRAPGQIHDRADDLPSTNWAGSARAGPGAELALAGAARSRCHSTRGGAGIPERTGTTVSQRCRSQTAEFRETAADRARRPQTGSWAMPGNERKACRLSAQAGIDRKSAMLPFKSTQPGPLSIFSGKVKKVILSSYLLFALAQQAHSRTQRSGAKPGGNTRFSVTGLDGGLVRWPEGSIRPLDKARNPGRCREQASSPDASDG